jgi:hypothetical protein
MEMRSWVAKVDTEARALETAFWDCDYMATRQLVDQSTAAYCSTVTEALKNSRFDGRFDALHWWWQQRKADEHAARDRAWTD